MLPSAGTMAEAAGSRRHYEQAEEAARELLLGFLRSL
jgi:hypothetical protein